MDEIRVSSRESRPGRLIVAHILPKADLMSGLLKICKEHNLKAGCIVTILGGLAGARVLHPVLDPGSRIGISYGDPVDIKGPLEVASGGGLIGVQDSGELVIHLHGVLADVDKRVYTGHFVEGGSIVLSTLEVVIQEIPDVEIVRSLHEETGFAHFKVYEKTGREKGDRDA